jgi:ribulose-bisphosphate carboxylase large chain
MLTGPSITSRVARRSLESGHPLLENIPDALKDPDYLPHMVETRSELCAALMSGNRLLGSFVVEPTHGIAHGTLLGTIARLAGADVTIFPNHGGRFSFSPDECREIVTACRAPLGSLAPILPAPAGGMKVERVAEMRAFYGDDVVLLIGGDLHRGPDLVDRCKALRELVE